MGCWSVLLVNAIHFTSAITHDAAVAGMATPQHTPYGRGFQEFYGYFQHANNYWTKGTDLPSTGEVDICLNHFTDLTVENKTYRGGELDPAALDSSCSDSSAADPSCYEEHLFKLRGLKVINDHDPATMGPLFYMHAFHLIHRWACPQSPIHSTYNHTIPHCSSPSLSPHPPRTALVQSYHSSPLSVALSTPSWNGPPVSPMDIPESYLVAADARLNQSGFTYDDEGRRNYSAMVRYALYTMNEGRHNCSAMVAHMDALYLYTIDYALYSYTVLIHYRLCTILIHYTHTLYSFTVLRHCTHTLYSCTILLHYTHTLYSFTVLRHCTHTLYSCTILIHYTHTLYSFTVLRHCTHTLYSCTILIHYTLCTILIQVAYMDAL
jgi:hypothetical protein